MPLPVQVISLSCFAPMVCSAISSVFRAQVGGTEQGGLGNSNHGTPPVLTISTIPGDRHPYSTGTVHGWSLCESKTTEAFPLNYVARETVQCTTRSVGLLHPQPRFSYALGALYALTAALDDRRKQLCQHPFPRKGHRVVNTQPEGPGVQKTRNMETQSTM